MKRGAGNEREHGDGGVGWGVGGGSKIGKNAL